MERENSVMRVVTELMIRDLSGLEEPTFPGSDLPMGRTLRTWIDKFGGYHGQWPQPGGPMFDIDLTPWEGHDLDRTVLELSFRTYDPDQKSGERSQALEDFTSQQLRAWGHACKWPPPKSR